jgi:hypothetical protein
VRSWIQASRPWSRSAGSSIGQLRPSTRAILAGLPAIPDPPFGGGPVPSRRRTGLEQCHWPLVFRRVKPLLLAKPSLRALTRVPSCATRARRERSPTTQRPEWLRCSAHNWLCFVARFQRSPLPRTTLPGRHAAVRGAAGNSARSLAGRDGDGAGDGAAWCSSLRQSRLSGLPRRTSRTVAYIVRRFRVIL